MQIKARGRDVLWNYGGLFFRMAGQFFVLPLVLSLLDSEYVGLWYVFTAVSGFIVLFQAGFDPTFARNVAYCWSGARSFSKNGLADEYGEGVDFGVLAALLGACRAVYFRISLLCFAGISTLGTLYVVSVSSALDPSTYIAAWALFCVSVFVNVHFSYWESMLRGVGDFVGVNKSTILASFAQIISSAAMLLAGCGILSCAVGFFLQGVVFRSYCKHFFYRVEGVSDGLAGASKPEKTDIEKIRLAISSNAYRDTAVSIANYVATTANTLLCAAFVGLAESSVFSVTLQLVNACVNVSAVMLTTYQPSLQSAYANRDLELERDLSGKSMASFALFYGVCLVLVVFIGMPILGIFKPGIDSRPLLTVLLGLYFFLWKQQSNCAMLIANTNRIPYMWPFVISAGLGIVASYLLLNLLRGSIYGLVLGQMVVQLAYNNWKWPHEAAKRLGTTYPKLMASGFKSLTSIANDRL